MECRKNINSKNKDTVCHFDVRRNHTRDLTKIGEILCGVSSVISPYVEMTKNKGTVCHFDGGEISTRSSTKIGLSLRSYLRRFLVPPLDLFFEILSKFMIEKGSKSKLFGPPSL